MIETLIAVTVGAVIALLGSGWAKSAWHCRQLEEELSERRRADAKRLETRIDTEVAA